MSAPPHTQGNPAAPAANAARTRIHVLSDVHLSRSRLEVPCTDADITVVAGDVARPEQAIAWLREFATPVVYVAGNHEFYGGSLPDAMRQLKALAAGSNVHVLDCESALLRGIRFLGATLWTDFMLDGEGEPRARAMHDAGALLRDFSRIASTERPGTPFSPVESTHVFARHRDWLARELAQPFEGPTVVVTHHAPSRHSIHPRYAGSPLNNAFVSDLEALMDGRRVALWIHGHTHDSFDYTVHGTRVVCNPRGYCKDGINENRAFDPDLTLSLGIQTDGEGAIAARRD